MARHKIYYKGESGGFPQVWVVVSFVWRVPKLLDRLKCEFEVETTEE
jgi:hypothetical protein